MFQARPEGTTPSRGAELSLRAPNTGQASGRAAKWRRRAAVVGALLASALSAVACLDRPICTECHPQTTNVFVDQVPQRKVDKIDLLFVIDNSRSMADKQAVLSEAVPDLVRRLVSPDCVSGTGERTPLGAGGTCPTGSTAEFQPVKDIHIGVISSSLGAPGCGDAPSDISDLEKEQRDDRGHLLGTRPRVKSKTNAAGLQAPTPEGFLDWNPEAIANQTPEAFNATFTLMTKEAGEVGCGYEAQLESFYRFLIDPVPPQSVDIGTCGAGRPCSTRRGVDAALLAERKAFLRPDSLVAVILLTDENDCSIRDVGQGFLATEPTIRGGSAQCAANPQDRCCYPCGTVPPEGCTPDPLCGDKTPLPPPADDPNLRCWNQKKRFGFDYLYPTARYVNALKQTKLCVSRDALDGIEPGQCPDMDLDGNPDLYDNPLFAGSVEALPRNPELIFFAGIIGVPYQDIATSKDPSGKDYPQGELHYLTAKQMSEQRVWDKILGDPNPPNGSVPVPPTNRLMVEDTSVRTGNDGQGNALGAPDGPPRANAVNGHEWLTADPGRGPSDLQYACTFELQSPRVCDGTQESCDCATSSGSTGTTSAQRKNPLCQDASGNYGTTQYRAKAYPGLRELEVLKGFGKNSIVASICARNLTNNLAQDYGYRPAVDAIVERLKEQLSDQCLPRTLRKNAEGKIPCAVVEVVPPGPGVTCDPQRGRSRPDGLLVDNVHDRLRALERCDVPGQPECSTYQLCKLEEADASCHRAGGGQAVPGWCYIDPATQPDDDATLVEKCQPNRRRILRFVGENTPAAGAEVLIACFGSSDTVEASPAPTATQ